MWRNRDNDPLANAITDNDPDRLQSLLVDLKYNEINCGEIDLYEMADNFQRETCMELLLKYGYHLRYPQYLLLSSLGLSVLAEKPGELPCRWDNHQINRTMRAKFQVYSDHVEVLQNTLTELREWSRTWSCGRLCDNCRLSILPREIYELILGIVWNDRKCCRISFQSYERYG